MDENWTYQVLHIQLLSNPAKDEIISRKRNEREEVTQQQKVSFLPFQIQEVLMVLDWFSLGLPQLPVQQRQKKRNARQLAMLEQ